MKMFVADLRIVLSVCVCTALAYHHSSKEDYIKWREKFLPKRGGSTTEPPATSANDINYENLKLRHHSRFPNLDRVMVKIDNMHQSKKHNEVGSLHNKIRHQNLYRTTTTTTTTTTVAPEEDLFGEDYDDDLEYDEGTDNEYDDWEDDDSLDEYEDEIDNDGPFFDNHMEWQAEEATEPPAPVSSLTKYKWENYGTRSRVEESRRQQFVLKPSPEHRTTDAAIEHYTKVRQQVQCRNPLPKVISVQSEHPDPSKSYTPHCTILHRCAEDTGCCSNYDTKCGPKTQDVIHLYFFTTTIGVARSKVERLTFYNHTECACIPRSEQPSVPRTINDGNVLEHGVSLKSATNPENFRQCRCPGEYTARFRYQSGCSCDCEDHNADCIRMKKGKEFFGLTDRMCIMEKQCEIPTCEYGIYNRPIGRCPRKQEKLESYSKLTIK